MKAKSPSRPKAAPPPAGRLDPLDWIGEAGAQPDILRAMYRQVMKRRRRRVTLVSSAAAMMLAALVWQRPWTQSPVDSVPAASAIVHVPASQILPDGSIVELKDGAAIKVVFTDAIRRVELSQGEAHFQVTKNTVRPFIVAVGNIEVRAVGTAFSVDLSATQVEVLVTEGRVAIDQVATNSSSGEPSNIIPAAPINLAMLGAGDRTVVELAVPVPAPIETLQSAEVNQLLAWRVPRLEFSGTPLGEAIPMINAYSRVKLLLADDSLASVQLSGVLRADNIETLRELLAESHGIRFRYRTETEIVLTREK